LYFGLDSEIGKVSFLGSKIPLETSFETALLPFNNKPVALINRIINPTISYLSIPIMLFSVGLG
jgi:hypothetical protein